MSNIALVKYLFNYFDPYFTTEIIILLGILLADYTTIGFAGISVNGSEYIPVSLLILKVFYVTFVILLALNIYLMANSLDTGRIIALSSFSVGYKDILKYMFIINITYSTIMPFLFIIFNVSFYFMIFNITFAFGILFYLFAFAVFFTGLGYFIAIISKSPFLSTGSLLVLFIFIGTIFSNVSTHNFILNILGGFSRISISNPFKQTFIISSLFEFFIGFGLFIISYSVLRNIIKQSRM